MKKVLTFVAVVAVSLSAVSCANNNAKQIDSLSYAIGADIGLNLSLGMKDFDLDREVVLANIEEFYKSGDVECKEIKEVREKMMRRAPKRYEALCAIEQAGGVLPRHL